MSKIPEHKPVMKDQISSAQKEIIRAVRKQIKEGTGNKPQYVEYPLLGFTITACYTFEGDTIRVGFTLCSPKDKYHKGYGRAFATSRMMREVPNFYFTEKVNTKFKNEGKSLALRLTLLQISKLATCGISVIPRGIRKFY